MSYQTQADKLLAHLMKRPNIFCSLSSCVRAMGGYRVSAAVYLLRKKYKIQGHLAHRRNHKILSFYRIIV